MLANDSVTVACEVPIYLDSMDIEHMRDKLGFIIPLLPDGPLKEDLANCCLKIPHFIAEAHSRRFDDKPRAKAFGRNTIFV